MTLLKFFQEFENKSGKGKIGRMSCLIELLEVEKE